MIPLVLGVFLPWAAMLAFGHVWDGQAAANTGGVWTASWRYTLLAPLACWLTAECFSAISPRRVLDRRIAAPIRKMLLGVMIGAFGVALTLLMIPLASRVPPPYASWATDPVILTVSGLTAAAAVLLPAAIQRRGHCFRCGYDIRTLPTIQQCPECGEQHPR